MSGGKEESGGKLLQRFGNIKLVQQFQIPLPFKSVSFHKILNSSSTEKYVRFGFLGTVNSRDNTGSELVGVV